jgi:hypothetical protein
MKPKAKSKKPVSKPVKKKAPAKNMGGRPTKYDQKYCNMCYQLSLLGLTELQMAVSLGVSEKTFNNWKNNHPGLLQAIKAGKEIADGQVAASLYQRALGYSHKDVDIKVIDGRIVKTELIKHYPPDATSAIFWLKNRQKEQWRDKQEIGLTDKEGNDTVTFYSKLLEKRLPRKQKKALEKDMYNLFAGVFTEFLKQKSEKSPNLPSGDRINPKTHQKH